MVRQRHCITKGKDTQNTNEIDNLGGGYKINNKRMYALVFGTHVMNRQDYHVRQ